MRAMATIKEFPGAVKKMGVVTFLKKVWAEVSEDGLFTWASALAYSWVFALFPLLIAILTLAPYLPGNAKNNLKDEIGQTLYTSMGQGTATDTIYFSVMKILDQTKGGLLSIGLILAVWSASGGMAITMNALDKCYEVKTERSFVRHRLVAIGLTLATMVLILAVVVLLPVGTALLAYFENKNFIGPVAKVAINILRYLVAAGLLAGVVGLMYYFGPNIKQKWQTVTPGALLAVLMWIVMGVGFGFYAQNFGNFDKTYGTLGGGILLLLFFYLSAVVLLLGAEINSVLDFAVLGVKPGTRDFTQPAKQSKDAISGDQDETATAIAEAPAFRPDTVPAGPAPAGWWKWAAASVAGAWLAKKVVGPAGGDSAAPPARPV
jgi:membrane protein